MRHDSETLRNNIKDILKKIAYEFNKKNNTDKGKFMKIFTGKNYEETQDEK
ncbi:MAG: hypothetical protein QXF12_04010 [Candidatus Aenigmatarchaeota archaeon]